MKWNRIVRYSGFVGATVCSICVARACSTSNSIPGTVLAGTADASDETESQTNPLKGLKLKQVHVYFRHGARTPIHTTQGIEAVSYTPAMLRVPSHMAIRHRVVLLPDMKPRGDYSEMEDHYKKTPLKGGAYAGNLTTFGHHQTYDLGLRLRRDYMDIQPLLCRCFNPEELFVQSTNINRTIASAKCVIAGLFGKESINKKGGVVIPVSVTMDEVLFPNAHACEVLKAVNHSAMTHFDRIPAVKEDRLTVENAIGCKTDAPLNFVFLRDDLIARKTNGYRIPAPLLPFMTKIEYNATKLIYYAMCGQTDVERCLVTRLAAGPALSMMMTGMETFLAQKKTEKIFLYSTHDSTMVALLEAAGLFDWEWPPFAADLRMELYQDRQHKPWVRVLYMGKPQTIRGCSGTVISFEDFQTSLAPYLIARGDEFNTICASSILQEIAAGLLEHDEGEEETPVTKENSETPAGM